MEDLLSQIINYLMPQNNAFLYVFLFVSAIVENLFPPIPGDTITAFGAFLVGAGRLNYWMVYLVTTVGSTLGFMCLFFLGRYFDREFFMKKNYGFFSADSIVSAEEWFEKYGYIVVLANRFIPGVRSVISIVSGISGLAPVRVFFLSLFSAMIWNLIWIQAGYTLGNNWDAAKDQMTDFMKNYNMGAAIIITAVIVILVIVKRRKRRD